MLDGASPPAMQRLARRISIPICVRGPSVGEIDAAGIAAYVEHLAVRRQVLASTQYVALNALVFVFREICDASTSSATA